MATKFGCLLFVLQIIPFSLCTNDILQDKFTSRCDEICGIDKATQIEDGKKECQRGCQYFNLGFLTNARNKDKVTDLNFLLEKCAQSCFTAYPSNRTKKEDCFGGCNKMMALQSKAPFINGWLVYMGAAERNMVLLQPDFDIPSKEDWVLLDSMFRANDYDYDGRSYEQMLADNRQVQSIQLYPGRQRFTISYCIPTWMWMVPLMLLIGFIWIHYSNYIYSVFIREGLEQELMNSRDKKFPEEDFVVGTDFYFYPTPAIPPPKYNEAAEAILMSGSDDEDVLNREKCFGNSEKNNKPVNIDTDGHSSQGHIV